MHPVPQQPPQELQRTAVMLRPICGQALCIEGMQTNLHNPSSQASAAIAHSASHATMLATVTNVTLTFVVGAIDTTPGSSQTPGQVSGLLCAQVK